MKKFVPFLLFLIFAVECFAANNPFLLKEFNTAQSGATTGQPVITTGNNGEIYLALTKRIHKFSNGSWSKIENNYPEGDIFDIKVSSAGHLYIASYKNSNAIVYRMTTNGSYVHIWNRHLPHNCFKMRLVFPTKIDGGNAIYLGVLYNYYSSTPGTLRIYNINAQYPRYEYKGLSDFDLIVHREGYLVVAHDTGPKSNGKKDIVTRIQKSGLFNNWSAYAGGVAVGNNQGYSNICLGTNTWGRVYIAANVKISSAKEETILRYVASGSHSSHSVWQTDFSIPKQNQSGTGPYASQMSFSNFGPKTYFICARNEVYPNPEISVFVKTYDHQSFVLSHSKVYQSLFNDVKMSGWSTVVSASRGGVVFTSVFDNGVRRVQVLSTKAVTPSSGGGVREVERRSALMVGGEN